MHASAQEEAPITAKDLEGEWVGYNYFCEGTTPPQRMIMASVGPRLTMTKTLGDACVPSGHRTWEGVLIGNTARGSVYVSNGPGARPIRKVPATLTVISRNELRTSFGATYRRGDGEEPEPVSDERGDIEVTLIKKRSGERLLGERVKVFRVDNGQEVGSAYVGFRSNGETTFQGLRPGEYRVFLDDEGWTNETREAIVTVEANKTVPVTLELDFTSVVVRGRLQAYRNGNKRMPVIGVPVRVLFSDMHEETVYTNERGVYEIQYDNPPEFYILEVQLKSEEGEIDVRARRGFSGNTITLKTKRIDIDRPRPFNALRFAANERRLSNTLNPARKQAVEHGGTFYAYTYKAMSFAEDKLNVRFNYKLPVEVELWDARANTAFYSSASSEIKVPAAGTKSLRTNSSSPDNREYHEFGHHLHTDVAMSGENKLPPRPAGNTNHGGIDNLSSSDSYVEGFAEFYALWVKGSSIYKWGPTTDLENNLQNLNPRPKRDAAGQVVRDATGKVVTETVMDEEFQVAALLWDVLDSSADAGDNINLTDRQMWAVINRVQVFDVPTLYKELKGPLGRQKTDPNAALGDVDALFVAHRFFSDTNGNKRHDPGEQIGVADFYHKAGTRTVRQQRPPPQNSTLRLTAPEEVGEVRFAQLSLRYPNGRTADFGLAELDDGRVMVSVPENAQALSIQPIVAGYRVEPIILTPEAYAEAYVEALLEEREVLLEVEITAEPLEIEAASTPVLGRDEDGLLIGWTGQQGQQFALVEGAARSPLILDDGEILYRGGNPYHLITTIEDYETVRFFSVFVFGANGEVSQPLMFTWPTDISDQDGRMPWWLRVLIGLLLTATVLWFFLIGRRKKKEEQKEE